LAGPSVGNPAAALNEEAGLYIASVKLMSRRLAAV
jgi:hypothetical protein